MGNAIEQQQWHEVRSKGIGGSEIAAVLGLDQYRTPYALWEVKTGRAGTFEENKFTRAGHYLEPVVVQMFEDETGMQTYGGGTKHFAHPEHPFCIGTPDRFVAQKMGDAVLECKTTQKAIAKDSIPLSWYFQNIWYQGITGKHGGFIAWLSRGVDFDYIEIPFNAETFEQMVEQARAFWVDHVLADVPPPPMRSEDINRMAGAVGGTVALGDEFAAYYRQIKANAEQIKELEEANEELKEAVMLAMGKNDQAHYVGIKMFTWKEQKGKRLNQKRLAEEMPDIFEAYKDETSTRVFRVC